MLRFFSRRHKPRRDQKAGAAEQYGYLRSSGDRDPSSRRGGDAAAARKRNKNLLECKIILLDGSDITVDLQVGQTFIFFGISQLVMQRRRGLHFGLIRPIGIHE